MGMTQIPQTLQHKKNSGSGRSTNEEPKYKSPPAISAIDRPLPDLKWRAPLVREGRNVDIGIEDDSKQTFGICGAHGEGGLRS
jgi:hypothetical protein